MQLNEKGVKRLLIGLAIIIGATQSLAFFLPDLLRPDMYNSDACQHIWWTNRFADPGLFPNDFIADFFSRPIFAPFGFQAIYWFFTRWIDAQTLSELIPFFLAVPVLILAWLIGRRTANGHIIGGFIAVVFASFGILDHMKGGFPRSFAQLILMLGVWSLMARRHGWLGIAFLLAAAFYPQSGINLGLLTAVILGWRLWQERRLPNGWPFLALSGLVAAVIVGSVYGRHTPAEIGPKVTSTQARSMPEMGPAGRSRFFENNAVTFLIDGKRSGLGIHHNNFFAFLALLAAGLWWRRKMIPLEAWVLIGTSLIAFGMAHLLLFSLHLPNRYVSHSGRVFLMMFLAGLTAAVWQQFAKGKFSEKFTAFFSPVGVQIAAGTLVAAGFIACSAYQCHQQLSHPVDHDLEAVFTFIKTLPRDTRVAAHPVDAIDIPLRARRSVIASREVALPYYLGYYQRVKDAINAEVTACFATNWADVAETHSRFGADVFVVNTARYHGAKDSELNPPFSDAALAAISRGERDGFVLEHPPADRIMFAAGQYFVVSLKP